MNKENKISCCQLNSTLQETYYEQIMGKKGYGLGFYTAYYYLLKDFKKSQLLCEKCERFSQKLFEMFFELRQKYGSF